LREKPAAPEPTRRRQEQKSACFGPRRPCRVRRKRADSIKRFLMQNYGTAGADLVTVGYGKSKLKDPSRPLAEVNPRGQVVDMENKTTAAK